MAAAEQLEAVRSIAEAILAHHDYELVDLKLTREGRRMVLRVTVDSLEGGSSLDDIAAISEELSRALDEFDPIEVSYLLEVESAGLERPLVKPADYLRFAGQEIRVRSAEPVEGRRNFQGILTATGQETFVMQSAEGETVELPYSAVASARLVVDWDVELKSGRES